MSMKSHTIQDLYPKFPLDASSFQKTKNESNMKHVHIPYAWKVEYSLPSVSTLNCVFIILHNSPASDRRLRGLFGFVWELNLKVCI